MSSTGQPGTHRVLSGPRRPEPFGSGPEPTGPGAFPGPGRPGPSTLIRSTVVRSGIDGLEEVEERAEQGRDETLVAVQPLADQQP